MDSHTGNRTDIGQASPVDDHTYNVLQALTSTLESIEAYTRYQKDDGGDLFRRLVEDERSHAAQLLDELRERLVVR